MAAIRNAFLVLVLISLPLECVAAIVCVMQSESNSQYSEFLNALEADLPSHSKMRKITVFNLKGNIERARRRLSAEPNCRSAKAVVALGASALKLAKEEFAKAQIYYAMILDATPFLDPSEQDRIKGISLLLPAASQLAYLKLLLPDVRTIAVVHSPYSKKLFESLEAASKKSTDIDVVAIEAESPSAAIEELSKNLKKFDAIWMVPDPIIYEMFPPLQEFSLDEGRPIIALTDDMAEIGAAVALSPDYAAMGSQMAAKLSSMLAPDRGFPQQPGREPEPPIGTTITVNRATLEQLGMPIREDAEALVARPYDNPWNPEGIRMQAVQPGEIDALFFTESFFRVVEVITASRTLLPVTQAPANMTVITRDDIRFSHARNITELLSMIAGTSPVIDHLGDTFLEIRGTRSTNKFLFMVDSHALNNQMFGGTRYVLNAIPLEAVKQVEVVRGPVSSLYGANAFVGVINVITRRPEQGTRGSLQGQYGSFDTNDVDIIGSIGASSSSFLGTASRHDTERPDERIQSDAEGVSGNTQSDLKENSLFGKWQMETADRGNFQLSSMYSRTKKRPYIGQAFVLNDESERKHETFYLDARQTLRGDNFNLLGRAFLDHFRYDAFWELRPEGSPVPDFQEGQLARDQAKDLRLGAELQADLDLEQWRSSLTAAIGYYYFKVYDTDSEDNFTPSADSNIGFDFISLRETDEPWMTPESQRQAAALVQWTVRPKRRLSFMAGLRVDDNEKYGTHYSPRAAAIYQTLSNVSTRLVYGSAFRSPTFFELNARKQGDIVGNPQLDPEEVDTLEVEVSYEALSRWRAQAAYFRNTYSDLIGPDPTRLRPPRKFVNLDDDVVQQGFEAELSGPLTRWAQFLGNYSYVTGDNLDLYPQHKANLLLDFALSERLSLSYRLGYLGSRSRAAGDTRNDLDAVTIHGLGVRVKLLGDRLELKVDGRNLSDEEISSPDPTGLIPDDYPMPGRAFYGTLRVGFP